MIIEWLCCEWSTPRILIHRDLLSERMLHQGHLKPAVSFFKWCIEELSGYKPAYLNLSAAFADRGEPERARHSYKLGQALQPAP